jgi:hypothetical protein
VSAGAVILNDSVFSSVADGSINVGGVGIAEFASWSHEAVGGVSFVRDETSVYYGGKISVVASGQVRTTGVAVTTSSNLGTLLVSAVAESFVLSENVKFGYVFTMALVPPTEFIDSTCCGLLPPLLYMNHQISKFAKLDKFILINSFSVRSNLNLVYSAKKNIWINNLHYKGYGVTNDLETWDVISEFGCIDDLEGVPSQDQLWAFSLSVINRNLRTRLDKYSRVVLGFDPTLICNANRSIDSTFTVNVRTRATVPVALRSVILYDEIGLFKGSAFAVNQNLKFRVSSSSIPVPLSNLVQTNSLQEILA